MKGIFFAGLFFCLIHANPITGFSQSSVDLPGVVPPPADAASLGKYGDVPVNLSVGTPGISVPIYEIKTSRLSVPVTLSYYAAGVKVDDMASWVGLGWSLDAGGLITRTVRDLDDFVGGGRGYYFNNNLPLADTLTVASDWDYMDMVASGELDVEPDYFFYNFSGHAGKFFFGGDKQPVIINYQDPIKVQSDGTGNAFTIYDSKGNQFLFMNKDTAQSYSTSLSGYPSHGMTYISGWNLSRIISFDKSDTISFQYYRDAPLLQTFNNYSEGVGPTFSCSSFGPTDNGVTHDGLDAISSESFLWSAPQRLQEIDYRNGKVVFFSSGPRTDNGEVKLDSVLVYGWDNVSQGYSVLRTVRLAYDYFVSNFNVSNVPALGTVGYRLRLDSVRAVGSGKENGGSYAFLYDSTMLPNIGSVAKDLFNNYNGAVNNKTLIPAQTVNYEGALFSVGGADRGTNPDSIQAGILKHIYYPTGGRTDLTYEPNTYQTSNYSTNPVRDIASATGQMIQIDTFTFVASATVVGTLQANVSRYNYTDVQTRPYVSMTNLTTGQVVYANYLTDPVNGLTYSTQTTLVQGQSYQLIAGAFDDGHVGASISVAWTENDSTLAVIPGGGLRIRQTTDYDFSGKFVKSELYKYGVGESGYGYMPSPSFLFNTFNQGVSFYLGCAASDRSGRCPSTVYSRNIYSAYSIYDMFNFSSAPLSYPEVAKYLVDSTGNISGKTVYDYTVYQNGILPVASNPLNNGIQVTNSGFAGGQLLSQSDYAYRQGAFVPVKRVVNTYNNISLQTGRGSKIGYGEQASGCYMTGPSGPIPYYFFDYPIYSGTVLPASVATYDFDMNDTTKYAVNTQQFTYDNLDHLQPTAITSDLSDGSTLFIVNRYPEEVDAIANLTGDEIAAIDSLISGHNITALIQTQTFQNSDPVRLTRYDYRIWQNNMVLPDSVEMQMAAFPVEKRMQYYGYDDRGNLLQVSKANDVPHSYIWDYHGQYPVAEVSNAAPGDVAYTSFEADGTGNWTVGSAARDYTTGITGAASYVLNSDISRSNLSGSTVYVVSYWTKNASPFTIAGTVAGYPQKGKTISINGANWTYYEHKVTGQTTIALTGSGYIDELRLYPVDAQMKTYAYRPQVGMISQCDEVSRVTYYTYDGLERLIYTRDQDGNILKTIEYHYRGY
jgi:YD repeat-containing protein